MAMNQLHNIVILSDGHSWSGIHAPHHKSFISYWNVQIIKPNFKKKKQKQKFEYVAMQNSMV